MSACYAFEITNLVTNMDFTMGDKGGAIGSGIASQVTTADHNIEMRAHPEVGAERTGYRGILQSCNAARVVSGVDSLGSGVPSRSLNGKWTSWASSKWWPD